MGRSVSRLDVAPVHTVERARVAPLRHAFFTGVFNLSTRRLISISAAAAELGVCDRTIRRYLASGRLKGYRVGGRMIRVDAAQLDMALSPIGIQG